MKFLIVLLAFTLGGATSSLAQSRASISVDNATPTPKPEPTDEYGIPLKLKKGAAAQATPKPAVLSGMQDSATTETPKPAVKRRPVAAAKKKQTRKKRTNAPEAVAPEVLENQATQELMLSKDDLSQGVLPTPATVRSRIEEVENPIRPLEYRLGVSIQPFTPKGSMPLTNLVPYDLADAGTNAMVALEGQWLPIRFENQPGLEVGPFASVGYAQFKLALRSPTGVQLGDTKLHAIKAQLGATASYVLPKSPLWSVHGNLGVGRLQLIQTSSVSYADASSGMNFASLGVSGERSLTAKISVFAGYDLRVALSRVSEGADVPNHNLLLGFLGNFE